MIDMNIVKIIKRNKKEYTLDCYIENNNFVEKITTHDKIIFNCSICNKEASREKQFFIVPLTENSFLCKECQTKQTNLERYGVENTFQNEEKKERIKQTNLERYGVEYPSQSNEIREKTKKKNLLNFGVPHVLQNKEVLEKVKNTTMNRYGVINFSKLKNTLEKKLETQKEKFFNSLIERNNKIIKPLFNLQDYDGVKNKYKWECLKCGNIFEDNIDNGKIPRCFRCDPINYRNSNKEKEVAEFINSLGFEIIENYRDKFELDIFIPSLNFGIEFDGLYWHSDKFRNKFYHIEKTLYFKEKGIDIIHIFEDEWDNKQEIVKSIIKSRLNKFDRIIYARKTEIRNVEIEEERNFLNENHIQGYIPSKICLGLYYENELISLMSFGKSRFNKNYEWELLRFVNKINIKVTGGASKLFKNIGKANIISYCDLRYFTGEIYKVLGFNLIGKSKPNYYYINSHKRYSRIKFQKHKLKDLLENFDEELTESENMHTNGYSKIYDCGMLVFAKNKPSVEGL